MRKQKSLVAFALCVLLNVVLVCVNVPTYGQSGGLAELQKNGGGRYQTSIINRIEDMLGKVATYPDRYGFSLSGRTELGTRINAYVDNAVLSNVHYYPVLSGGSVVAIASVYGEGGNVSVSLAKDFAGELNAFVGGGKVFAIRYSGDDLNVVFEDREVLLKTYPGSGQARSGSSGVQSGPLRGMEFSQVEVLESLDVTPVVGGVSSVSGRSGVMSAAAPPKPTPTPTPKPKPVYWYLDVARIQQTHPRICWAASVASIGEWHTGILRTADWVVNAHPSSGYGAVKPPRAMDKLASLYNVRYNDYVGAPTYSVIINNVSAGNPIYAHFENINYGHTVVFNGYWNFPSGFSIDYMDPADGFIRQLSNVKEKEYSISSAGTMYKCVTHGAS